MNENICCSFFSSSFISIVSTSFPPTAAWISSPQKKCVAQIHSFGSVRGRFNEILLPFRVSRYFITRIILFFFRSKILRSESSAASMSSLTLGRSPRGILGAGQPSAKLSVPQLKTEEEAVTAEDKAYVIAVGRLNSMRWPSRKDHTLRSPSPPANRPRECHVTRFCLNLIRFHGIK